jgi:hypothetical protein
VEDMELPVSIVYKLARSATADLQVIAQSSGAVCGKEDRRTGCLPGGAAKNGGDGDSDSQGRLTSQAIGANRVT